MLSEDDVKKYQEIYRGYYGKEIGKEDAYREASGLLIMLTIISEALVKKRAEKERGVSVKPDCENPAGGIYFKKDE
jgi:hypothetical protein